MKTTAQLNGTTASEYASDIICWTLPPGGVASQEDVVLIRAGLASRGFGGGSGSGNAPIASPLPAALQYFDYFKFSGAYDGPQDITLPAGYRIFWNPTEGRLYGAQFPNRYETATGLIQTVNFDPEIKGSAWFSSQTVTAKSCKCPTDCSCTFDTMPINAIYNSKQPIETLIQGTGIIFNGNTNPGGAPTLTLSFVPVQVKTAAFVLQTNTILSVEYTAEPCPQSAKLVATSCNTASYQLCTITLTLFNACPSGVTQITADLPASANGVCDLPFNQETQCSFNINTPDGNSTYNVHFSGNPSLTIGVTVYNNYTDFINPSLPSESIAISEPIQLPFSLGGLSFGWSVAITTVLSLIGFIILIMLLRWVWSLWKSRQLQKRNEKQS